MCCLSLTAGAQTIDYSYVKSRTMTNETATTYLDHYDYDNGLGQLYQQIDVGITPNYHNLVTLYEYDSHRRPSLTWLPTEMSGSGVQSGSSVKSSAQTLYGDTAPYEENIYEPSPLGRLKEKYLPGVNWHQNTKRQTTDWYTNTTSNPEANALVLTMNQNTLSFSNTGQFYMVEKTADEDGRRTITFTDKNGQVAAVMNYSSSNPGTTYYAYDDFGDLRFVLPPQMSGLQSGGTLNPTSTQMLQYGYEYRYDNRHNCIYKRLPGCDPIYYIYDKAGRCIYSQDGEQRNAGKWSFSIPDALGRTVMTGVCSAAFDYTAEPLRNTVVKATRSTGNMNVYCYTFNGISLVSGLIDGTIVIHTVQYYDDYGFIGNSGFPSVLNYTTPPVGGYGTRGLTTPKGLPTGSVTARLTPTGVSSTYDYATVFYDERGRIVQTKSSNYLGGYDFEYTGYDFTGNVLKRQHVHNISGGSNQTETYTYTYDQAGRLKTTKHKLNNSSEVTIHQNAYDAVGRLTSRSNGTAATATYAYNVRSWLSSITAGTLFSETLYYNDSYVGSTKQYGGNVSAIKWKADTKIRGYKFSYDDFSRLLRADYLENGSASTRYSTEYTYDKMGNLLTLKRNGMTSTNNYGQIDNLTFTYNGNQVTRIDDASTNNPSYNGAFHFINGVSQANEYTYDQNGNQTKDLNKNISSIQYNSLNLPSKVIYGDNKNMEYVYSATGEKRSVTFNILVSGGNYSYCSNYIYYNNTLDRILIDGGYITFSNSNPVYHYYMKDHLGNNRMVVNASGTVEQVNHYYPFGGLFGESTNGGTQDYKYNGKEFNRLIGLDWYDYGARHMDCMRFTTMDPMAEKYYSISPYAYCGNNPLLYLDKEGKWEDIYTASLVAMVTGIPLDKMNSHPYIIGEHRYTLTTTRADGNGGFIVTSHHTFDSELVAMMGSRIENLGNQLNSSGEILEGVGDVAIGTGLLTSFGAPQIGGSLSAIGVGAVTMGTNMQIIGDLMSITGEGFQGKNLSLPFKQLMKDIIYKGLGYGTSGILKREIPGFGATSGEKMKSAKTLYDSGIGKQYDNALELENDEDEEK